MFKNINTFESLLALENFLNTSLSKTVHNNITNSLFPIGDETPKQAFIRTIKRFKPEKVAAYFNLPVDEFKAKYYNVKRGRPAGFKGVVQKSGSKITPDDLESIIGCRVFPMVASDKKNKMKMKIQAAKLLEIIAKGIDYSEEDFVIQRSG